MLTPSEIGQFVAAYGQPEVISTAEDTHIFHFERDGDWRSSTVLLVNRNGHHFRLLKQNDDGRWLFVKTWNKLLEYDGWQVEANLRRGDPEDLIRLCGVGPQGKQSFEALSLLPKEATQGRRRAVWRNHIVPVRFNVQAATFSLICEDGQGGGAWSPTFQGKLWESREAARWCLANMSGPVTPAAQAVRADIAAAELAVLEESEMWGMF